MSRSWARRKDKDEILDYRVDWRPPAPEIPALDAGDTIVASTWEFAVLADGELVIESNEFDERFTTVWLSGGMDDQVYELTNRIETELGRTMDQTCRLKMKTR